MAKLARASPVVWLDTDGLSKRLLRRPELANGAILFQIATSADVLAVSDQVSGERMEQKGSCPSERPYTGAKIL